MYLLHVSDNMLEMTENKGGAAKRIRLIAYCIRRLCRMLVYGHIAVAVVSWTTIYRQTYDDKPKEFRHHKVFDDAQEAQRFYDHRPKGLFECLNSLTAMPGFCEVKDVKLNMGDQNGKRAKRLSASDERN